MGAIVTDFGWASGAICAILARLPQACERLFRLPNILRARPLPAQPNPVHSRLFRRFRLPNYQPIAKGNPMLQNTATLQKRYQQFIQTICANEQVFALRTCIHYFHRQI